MSSPIIYLDQCHWITLARALFAKHKISSEEECASADFILKAARDGQICLPLSGAHMVETTKAGNGPRRQQLAETMLFAYGGWHMNNPVTVRGREMIQAFAQQDASLYQEQVFNRRPGTPFGIDGQYLDDDQMLSPEIRRFVEDVSWRYAWADMLRSHTYDPSEWTAISEARQGWVGAHQDLSTYLRDHPAKRDLRVVAATRTLTDLEPEFVAAMVQSGVNISELQQRLHAGNLVEFFQQLPFVGRLMEITYLRLRNPQDSWVENDLIDLLFLSCAAAYADFVVAERKSAHLLHQAARKTRPGAIVFASLRELRSHLEI